MNGLAFLALILSVLLSCVVAWIIAFQYRRRMQRLMRASYVRDSTATPSIDVAADPRMPPAMVSLADNHAAAIRLSLILTAVSCLIAVSSACIWWTLSFPEQALAPRRVAVIALLHLWPMLPALALVWRWSWKRLFGTFLLWCVMTFIVMLRRQIEMRPLEALAAMVGEIGLSLVLVSLVFLGNATRAVAPWVLMPAALLMYSSLSGFYLMMQLLDRQWPPIVALFGLLDRYLGSTTIYAFPLLFMALPWLVAWWPARLLGRGIGRAYSRKWLSDLLVVFAGVWAFVLTDRALTVNQAAAATMYLPLLFIPGAMWLAGRWWPRLTRPPTLLVLRVFQQDARARSLFDHVVERWRLSGNTVMIAGTDLADRTLDAHDIFQFLDGQLARRFVSSPADVARCIDEFDLKPDLDGRYRVNECYCHDTTWQDALQALVHRSDVVLMDLGGFSAHNAGCRYELATLAAAPGALRVVVLTDSRTDRAAALAEISAGPADRFSWIDVTHFNANTRRDILARMFA